MNKKNLNEVITPERNRNPINDSYETTSDIITAILNDPEYNEKTSEENEEQ
ncbi:hypothetical protein [Acetobacterium woodii]|uniref:hypothetical protein n=1 Tax=Acetobacterium woodii TaxID=33952 RepID=UPI0002FB28FE|nr:hypothetical protein [Acetobacterium woodii]